MANDTLSAARAKNNNEFYTQYSEIQAEINAYLEFDPDTFRDKAVLLPCDDPEWSNFTRFFAQNFEMLGLKKMEADHVTAWSKGGATSIDNCTMLCVTHNRAKGNK